MSGYRIWIEGLEMDLDEKTGRIATTKQDFDFFAIGSANGGLVKASRINRISLPLTSKNRTQLQQISPLSIIGTKTRENLSIRITSGIDVLPVGICQIVGVQDRIEIDAQSTKKNFFDALDGLYLNDIDLSAYNGLWDDSRRDGVRDTSSGLVCPVVSSGQFLDDPGNNCLDLYTYGVANVPFFYYKTIFEKILAFVGYSLGSAAGYNSFVTDSRYLNSAMSTRLVFNEQWLAKKEFIATNDGTQVVPSDTIPPFAAASQPKINFTIVTGNGDGFFDLASDTYSVNNPDTALEYFRGTVTFSCRTSKVGAALFSMLKNGVAIGTTTYANDIVIIESGIIEFKHNDSIEVHALNNFSAGNLNVTNAKLQLKTINTTDTDLTQASDWYLYFNQLLPRIPLKTFIVDFMIMYGLLMKEKNGELYFKGISEILSSPVTGPTSTELSREDKSALPKISYKLPGFAKSNEYRWNVQADEPIINDDHGMGSIVIDNDQLADVITRYTSIFTASDTNYVVRINQCADFPIYDQGAPAFTKAASFGNRLVMLRADDGVNVRFIAGTSRTDYLIGYFIDPNRTPNFDWAEILGDKYSEFEEALNKLAVVDQRFFLTLTEFCNADLMVTKHKRGTLYLVAAIDNYVEGQSSVFKMIRI